MGFPLKSHAKKTPHFSRQDITFLEGVKKGLPLAIHIGKTSSLSWCFPKLQ